MLINSNIKNHQKKPLTKDAAVFFKRLFPREVFYRLNKLYDLDKHTQKLKFRPFCIFLIVLIIFQPQDTSLRGIENLTKDKGIQLLTGQVSISHTSIANRLKSIPTDSLNFVLESLVKNFKKRLKYKNPTLRGMKVFDVTTFSVSAKHYKWAAQRQSRANIRFLFVMDSYSGTPDAIVDASRNLNDNRVFKTAISSAKNARYFVFDKGFNKFSIFKLILERKQHFITRWKTNYIFSLLLSRKINLNEKLEKGWIIQSDEIGEIDIKSNQESITVRKIVCWNSKLRKSFTILTDERNIAPNKIVQMYVYRWPIEVLFRHIKSNLNVIHFPSHDAQGVRNWILLVALSILIIQHLSLEKQQNFKFSLMMRNSAFKPKLRKSQLKLREWTYHLVIESVQ